MNKITWLDGNQIQITPPKRTKKVTGTRFATILGLNPWSTSFEIWCAITRLSEEVSATLDSLRDTLKTYMTENGLDTVTGSEHKASYKKVTSSRLDSAALKKELPEIAAKYTKTTETRRFLFV